MAVKSNRNQDESKVYELHIRINALNDKIAKMAAEKT